jgi:signal transduction histidine kinase
MYPAMIALTALCLLAADRVLVAEHDQHERMGASQLMSVLSKNFGRFLNRRTDAVKTTCALLREARVSPAETFHRHAGESFGALEGVEFVRLVSRDGMVLASWPAGTDSSSSGVQPPFDGPGDFERPQWRAPDARGGNLDVVENAGVPEGDELRVWARFSVAPIAREMRDPGMTGAYEGFVTDPDGVVVVGYPRTDASVHELKSPLPVPGASWDLRLRPLPQTRYTLMMRRAALLGTGLLLLTGFFILQIFRDRHVVELAEQNLELARRGEQHRTVVDRLLRLNNDLDEFTYVVSHDLKEPLRGVEGLAKLLIEEHGDGMNDTGRQYLVHIRDSGRRMRRMVDDLLRLSRVARRRYPCERFDFNELAREALTTLDYRVREKNATVIVQPNLPSVVSDRVRLTELLQNLLSNALKFTRDPAPRIEIEYEPLPEEHLFRVTDNGIGVPGPDRERIFNIFQRTASSEFGEGSGVGLTICKRIVENLGGRIWVESGPAGGSRFCFTLPARADRAGDDASTEAGGRYERAATPYSTC